jgi:uncharacterized membrane protein
MTAIHVYFGPDALTSPPVIRKIGMSDAFAALAEGYDDFKAMPSHLVFLAIFYVCAGVALTALSSFGGALHLVFPLAAGFALVAPFLAIGLYELSRRRELGMEVGLADALVVSNSPALPSLACLGLALVAIFALWIAVAEALYVSLYGPNAPTSASAFLGDVLTTHRGWLLIGLGGGIGFLFAVFVLCVTVVSFPLMLDRDVGLVPAVSTSLKLSAKSPVAVATWGAIVAVLLFLGALPMFIGLAIVMPVLGHGTWRFYRRAVVRDRAHEQQLQWPNVRRKPASYYSTPHSVLFPPPQKSDEEP